MTFKGKNGTVSINRNGILGAIPRQYNNEDIVEIIYPYGMVSIDAGSKEEAERIILQIDEAMGSNSTTQNTELETFKQGVDYAIKIKE